MSFGLIPQKYYMVASLFEFSHNKINMILWKCYFEKDLL